MSIERSLQVHIVALVIVSSVLLWMVRPGPLPISSTFVALTALYFVDINKFFRLNRVLANILALAALVFCSRDFFQSGSRAQLESISSLLIYLQIVLFYQEKNQRIYWQLTILSLLQVVVAAAMQVGVEFGMLLVLYMIVAFSTLVIFLVYRELEHVENREFSWGYHFSWLFYLRPRSRPRVTTQAVLNRHRVSRELLGPGFFRQVTGLGFATLLFTVVLFYCIPRVNSAKSKLRGRGRVGFAQNISLEDDVGKLLQDETPALRVVFRDAKTKEPQAVNGEVYLRGSVLAEYVAGTGKWYKIDRSENRRSGVSLSYHDSDDQWTMECTSLLRDHLYFATYPVHRNQVTPKSFIYDPWFGHVRDRHDVDSLVPAANFKLNTSAFSHNSQLPFTAHQLSFAKHVDSRVVYARETRKLAKSPEPATFNGLMNLANEVIVTDNLQGADKVRISRALRNHFRFSGIYSYTLDMSSIQRQRDVTKDPIEDFVVNHRQGHCQYFASALTIMLRSRNIPARVVVGFRSGNYNTVGGYYLIKQRHAHAWVEARFTREEALPYLSPAQKKLDAQYFWLRLDPTPASNAGEEESTNSLLAKVDETFDYAQLLWDEYVVGASARTKPSDAPTRRSDIPTSVMFNMMDESSWNTIFVRLWSGLAWLLLITGAATVGYLAFRLLSSFRNMPPEELPDRDAVWFYDRAEKLLADIGIRRTPSQTQREFGNYVLLNCNQRLPLGELRSCLDVIIDAFYQTQYGPGLIAADATRVEEAVSALEAMIHRVLEAESHKISPV